MLVRILQIIITHYNNVRADTKTYHYNSIKADAYFNQKKAYTNPAYNDTDTDTNTY